MHLLIAPFAAMLLLVTSCAPTDDGGSGKTRHVLAPNSKFLGTPPPDDDTVVVLLDRTGDLSHWRHETTPHQPLRWDFADGVLTIVPGSGSIVTTQNVTDFLLHLEFMVNDATAQGGKPDGNSGIYIQRRYEVQILDRAAETKPESAPGALYTAKAPDSDAALAAGQWQSYDIVFRAARWDGDSKTENARITAHLNGERIHDDVAITGKTGAGREESPDPGPIKLQDHGNAVKFRNIWMLPLDLR